MSKKATTSKGPRRTTKTNLRPTINTSKLPDQLKELRLPTFRELHESTAEQAAREHWTHTQFLADLVEKGCQTRTQSRIARLMCNANLLEHGPHGENEDITLFTVSLNFLTVLNPLSDAGPCIGTTDILANPGLTVDFDPFCSVEMTVDFPDPDTEETLSLFRLEPKTKGSGVTEIVLNFTTEDVITSNESLYITDRLRVNIVPVLELEGVFDLIPEIQTGGEFLTKGHRPGKGAMTEQPLLIGKFTYTPIPM